MNTWFRYFLTKSIAQRKGRFIISSSAVTLTVTVVTALVTLSLGVRDKIGAELKQYGANMIVTDQSGKEIDIATANELRSLPEHIKGSTFQLYGTATVKQISIEIVGAEPGKMIGYRLYGTLPKAPGEVMAGVNLKDVLAVKQGGALRFDASDAGYTVTALFEKGSDEDSAIVMPIDSARKLLGVAGVSAVLLNADTRRLKELEGTIRQRHPSLSVKTLKQVAVAEERILGRIQLLMLLVTGVALFSSVIALGSTMGANVIERMDELGLMKSIGATRGDIRKFFLSEAVLSGIAGSLAGYVAGIAAAEAVTRTAFGSFIPVSLFVMPGSVILGVFIATASTYFPVRDAMKVAPAQILRGE